MWYLEQTVKDAVENATPLIIRGAIPEERLFGWGTAVRLIDDHETKYCDELDHNKYCSKGGFVVHKLDSCPYMQYWAALNHEIFKAYGGRAHSVHMYGSLTKNAETFGIHRDTADVFYVGIIGRLFWEAYRDEDVKEYAPDESTGIVQRASRVNDPFFKEEVYPGDIVYMPRGMWHNTIPLKNRVGISMGREWFKMPWEEDDENDTD